MIEISNLLSVGYFFTKALDEAVKFLTKSDVQMKVVINPKYNFLTDFIYHLPGCFFKDGETIYQGRNILKKYDIQGYRLIVKRFKRPNINKPDCIFFFRRSKARRSFDYSLEVQKRGFGVCRSYCIY